MGAPIPGMESAERAGAHALADTFKTLDGTERGKHEAVLDYWLSIRGSRELPPLRDLDPLELSDAAPSSVLLELVGGGEDGEIRHLGEKLRTGAQVEKIASAPRPSVLASIARKLSIVAISRNFLAFEDEFAAEGFTTRCWVTMLPLSSAGAWVDYVYAFVTVETVEGEAAMPVEEEAVLEPDHSAELEPVEAEIPGDAEEPVAEAEEDVLELDSRLEAEPETTEEPEAIVAEIEGPADPVAVEESEKASASQKGSGFSFDTNAAGFYAKAVKVKPTLPTAEPVNSKVASAPQPVEAAPAFEAESDEEAAQIAAEVIEEPEAVEEEVAEPAAVQPEQQATAEEQPERSTPAPEGTLQSKLTEVRAKADEARAAKLRANAALYEGLGAAYDFALDAEDSPEEYLKLVEAKGLKIQLRSPMRPVVKLAFEGMCDEATIAQLERVLAWALDQELPRGTLADRIEEEGGLGPILNGLAQAA